MECKDDSRPSSHTLQFYRDVSFAFNQFQLKFIPEFSSKDKIVDMKFLLKLNTYYEYNYTLKLHGLVALVWFS